MPTQAVLVWGAAFAALASSVIGAAIFRRRHKNPRERERRRRDLVSSRGRVIEGFVTGCADNIIEYSYHWRGIGYQAWQDVSELLDAEREPIDFSGPATVKFLSSQPSNSIVISENWTGIPGIGRHSHVNNAQ